VTDSYHFDCSFIWCTGTAASMLTVVRQPAILMALLCWAYSSRYVIWVYSWQWCSSLVSTLKNAVSSGLSQRTLFCITKMCQLMVSREMLIFSCEKFMTYLAERSIEFLTFCQVVCIITIVPERVKCGVYSKYKLLIRKSWEASSSETQTWTYIKKWNLEIGCKFMYWIKLTHILVKHVGFWI